MILLCVHPQRCFATAGITRGEAGIRNAPLSPLQRFWRFFLPVFRSALQAVQSASAASAVPARTHVGTRSSSAAPAAFPTSGLAVGPGLSRCPVPAPPLGLYTFAHRRSSGTHDRVLAFVGITVVSGGVCLPTCLKRNRGLKGPSESTGRPQEVASASSCHPMSLLGTSLASSPNHR